MVKIIHYLGPDSPWGAGIAALATAAVTVMGLLIFMPPAIWIGGKIFGWWFRLWL